MQTLAAPISDSHGFVRAAIAGSLKDFLARYAQVDADRLLLDSGLDPAKLGNADEMLSLRSCLEFMENAARETQDNCFGLEFAAQFPWKDLGLLGYVMHHSPSLGVGLKDACRYFAVQQTLGQMAFSQGPVESRITYVPDAAADGRWGQNVEFMLLLIVRFCREATGRTGWTPRAVHVAHAAPPETSRHEQFFGTSVRFGQPENGLVLPTSDLQIALRSADPGLLPFLRRHADDLMARMPVTEDFVVNVRRLLTEVMNRGNATIEGVANRLTMTPRSLQRRLRDHGSSYQRLLAETRLALSLRYLSDDSLSLTEIAFLLDYSELSAFSRAFRRWTGQSPLDFRRRNV